MSNYGLTSERMMESFPLALQKDPKMVALAHAIASILEQRLDEITLGQIYTRINKLPDALLDILAKDFAIDWYDTSYALDEKRKIIKDSWYVQRHRGTKAAVERDISAIYPNAFILEWWEYEGLPYHFKLNIPIDEAAVSASKHQLVLQKISTYKNLRSHLDRMNYVLHSQPSTSYLSAAACSMSISMTATFPKIEARR